MLHFVNILHPAAEATGLVRFHHVRIGQVHAFGNGFVIQFVQVAIL